MAARVVLVVFGEVDDPVGAAEKLLAGDPRALPLEGVGWLLEPDDADPRRARTRARQARYRARRRDARDAGPRDARDAAESENSAAIGGPHTATDRREVVGRRMGRNDDANDARRDDANDATRRDAIDDLVDTFRADVVEANDLELVVVDDRYDDNPASDWRLPPRTDAETEAGRARIRELKDRLRELRNEAK